MATTLLQYRPNISILYHDIENIFHKETKHYYETGKETLVYNHQSDKKTQSFENLKKIFFIDIGYPRC